MTLDTVPWMVAGGAVHSAEVGRALAFAATNGNSGVTEGTDLAVRALTTPGTSVRIGKGNASIVNTYAGQSGQSYIARNTADENIAITATAGAARSDMLILRIDDPQYGGSAPANGAAVGPYAKWGIISNVGSTATEIPGGLGYPAIPLARIDIPAGTGTITQAMIKDLRKIANPKRKREVFLRTGNGALNSTDANGVGFPDTVGQDIEIPAWATTVYGSANVSGMIINGLSGASFRLSIGATADAARIWGNETVWDDGIAGNPIRTGFLVALKAAVPAAARGTKKPLIVRGRKTAGASPTATPGTVILYDIEFIEEPTVP